MIAFDIVANESNGLVAIPLKVNLSKYTLYNVFFRFAIANSATKTLTGKVEKCLKLKGKKLFLCLRLVE